MEYADAMSGEAGVERPQPRWEIEIMVACWRRAGMWVWEVEAEPPQWWRVRIVGEEFEFGCEGEWEINVWSMIGLFELTGFSMVKYRDVGSVGGMMGEIYRVGKEMRNTEEMGVELRMQARDAVHFISSTIPRHR